MSITELWDRSFWGFAIAIFVGLVWLKYVDPFVPCVWPGVIVAAAVGAIYVYVGVRKMRQSRRSEER